MLDIEFFCHELHECMRMKCKSSQSVSMSPDDSQTSDGCVEIISSHYPSFT